MLIQKSSQWSLINRVMILYLLLSLAIGVSQFNFSNGEHSIECFMILAGRDATGDGSVLAAHNLELSGSEVALIEKYPREKHAPGEYFTFVMI